jgi:hypothetical protein
MTKLLHVVLMTALPAVALFVGGCNQHKEAPAAKVVEQGQPAPTPAQVEDPRVTALKNLSYKIPDIGDVQLKNGKGNKTVDGSDIPVELDNRSGRVVFGDLGGGSGQDAVVVVGNGGGSHWQSYIALVLNTGGTYKNTSTVWPDLAGVETILIIPGDKIEVTGSSYGPNDPACCATQKAAVVYAVKNNTLYALGSHILPSQSNTADRPPESNTDNAPLLGNWSCSNHRNGGECRISFGAGGALEWIEDPGKIIETHRIGSYRLERQQIDITINQIPEFSKLGQSPDVSISEGAQIKSLSSTSLSFVWWQNSEPNDRVSITCTRYTR